MQIDDVFGVIAILFAVVIGLSFLVFWVYVWWRIVSRTGHSGWLSLLMWVPIAHMVLLLILAFGEWPIHRELENLKRREVAT